MRAGDWPLALQAARRLDRANALSPLRRILLAGEALRARNWAEAERQIARIEQEQVLVLMVPMLKAWRAYGMGERDPGALLAPMENGPTSGYAVEHRALLELARGQGDGSAFLALAPDSGLRAQHLRLLAAAEFAHRRDRAKALALAGGDQPAMIVARRVIEAGRPLPGRIDTAAEGFAEFLSRVAIDFSQQRLGGEGVILARLASYLAPESSQPLMIAAEIEAQDDPAAAARLLSGVQDGSPFIQAARDIRLRHLSSSGQAAAALAELQERTRRGSRSAGDWLQLGQIQQDQDNHAEAARSYARALELWRANPEPTLPEWTLVLAHGGALERSGQWPQARAALREAYRLAPTEPLVLNYLGYAQLDRGEAMEESERMIREALRLAPDNAAIVDSLGWALYRRGQVAEAIPILERAVVAEPADPEINEHLGDAYYSAGRRIEARFAWQAALVHATGPAVERLRRKIDRGLTPAVATR
jgi:tetratricopeptide (TPR) repeat protein